MKNPDNNSSNLPVRNGILPQEWLYNPVVYSQISGDFTLMQQRVLMGVLGALQDRILHAISQKERDKRFPSIFPAEETMGDVVELDIDPQLMGVSPDHYDDLEDALAALSKLTMRYPKYESGRPVYVIAPLFGRIEMPRGEVRRTGRVRITMLRRNVEDFFSLAHGYTVHLARIVRISTRKRTPRIYIFLSSFTDIGHKEVDYGQLLQFLGIDQESFDLDNRTGGRDVKENPFRKWTKVRSQVLEPCRLEMDAFCASGKLDFSFRYEALYRDGRERGNPDRIRFTIEKGPLAADRDSSAADSRRRHAFTQRMCEWCPDLNRYELSRLLERVSREELDDCLEYGYREVRRAVEQRQPDDVAAYTMTMMASWVAAREREARRRKAVEADSRCRELWEQCRDELASLTEGNATADFASLGYVRYDSARNTLTLTVPDRATAERIENSPSLQILADVLHRRIGRVRLQYSILNNGAE